MTLPSDSELSFPPGNLWEPPMARRIVQEYFGVSNKDWEKVEARFRFTLGLHPYEFQPDEEGM